MTALDEFNYWVTFIDQDGDYAHLVGYEEIPTELDIELLYDELNDEFDPDLIESWDVDIKHTDQLPSHIIDALGSIITEDGEIDQSEIIHAVVH